MGLKKGFSLRPPAGGDGLGGALEGRLLGWDLPFEGSIKQCPMDVLIAAAWTLGYWEICGLWETYAEPVNIYTKAGRG